jgi:inorganic pyrophosphatase
MGIEEIPVGKHTPTDVNVIIEIASYSSPIKYEIDKASGMLMVDRFIGSPMSYPCEYGFIPHTLSEDGDPVDVLVISPHSLLPGSVIRCRPIGLLRMTDESGADAKILAVPIDKLCGRYQHVQNPSDLGKELLTKIQYFFEHYKDLEVGKWVKIDGWEQYEAAHEEILASVKRYLAKGRE